MISRHPAHPYISYLEGTKGRHFKSWFREHVGFMSPSGSSKCELQVVGRCGWGKCNVVMYFGIVVLNLNLPNQYRWTYHWNVNNVGVNAK